MVANAEILEHTDADGVDLTASRLARRARYAAELTAMLDSNSVLWTEEQLRPYESDGLTAMKATPLVVVLPATIEQVQAIIRWANSNSVPVVARGAGTGLSGGALPHEDGILLGLAKFNEILELNVEHGSPECSPESEILPFQMLPDPMVFTTLPIRPPRLPAL